MQVCLLAAVGLQAAAVEPAAGGAAEMVAAAAPAAAVAVVAAAASCSRPWPRLLRLVLTVTNRALILSCGRAVPAAAQPPPAGVAAGAAARPLCGR